MAIILGLGLAAVIGIYHHFGLRALDRLTGRDATRPNRTMIAIFLGLLTIHLSEILIYAAVYALLLKNGWEGQLTGRYDGTWNDLVYFSGINFATLGYTGIETAGPIRMISMLQSLLGFMLITWSATFIYSAWEKAMR